jgi:hypothetical protein
MRKENKIAPDCEFIPRHNLTFTTKKLTYLLDKKLNLIELDFYAGPLFPKKLTIGL